MSSKSSNYTIRLKLTGFIDSSVIEVENQEGDLVRGVFIPIDINGIGRSERTGHYYFDAFVSECMYKSGDAYTHYVVQRRNAKDIEELARLGYTPPRLGYMYPVKKDFWFKKKERQSGRVKLTDLQ